MTIYSEFSHKKWWFSMAMLVYQRIFLGNKGVNITSSEKIFGSYPSLSRGTTPHHWCTHGTNFKCIVSTGSCKSTWSNGVAPSLFFFFCCVIRMFAVLMFKEYHYRGIRYSFQFGPFRQLATAQSEIVDCWLSKIKPSFLVGGLEHEFDFSIYWE